MSAQKQQLLHKIGKALPLTEDGGTTVLEALAMDLEDGKVAESDLPVLIEKVAAIIAAYQAIKAIIG